MTVRFLHFFGSIRFHYYGSVRFGSAVPIRFRNLTEISYVALSSPCLRRFFLTTSSLGCERRPLSQGLNGLEFFRFRSAAWGSWSKKSPVGGRRVTKEGRLQRGEEKGSRWKDQRL